MNRACKYIYGKRQNSEETEGNTEVLEKNSSGAPYFGVKAKRTRRLVKPSRETVVSESLDRNIGH